MYCQFCGKKIEEGWHYCRLCGKSIAEGTAEPASVAERAEVDTAEAGKGREPLSFFDTKKVKNENVLTVEQAEYLKRLSFSVLGPLNIVVRRHWDFVGALVVFGILDEIVGIVPRDWALMLAVVYLGLFVYLIYFMIAHGRRLAWNRNEWFSFEQFQESERKWRPWGIIMFILFVLSNAAWITVSILGGTV